MASSALLMLDDVSAPDVLPGKTGHYLAAGRPILCSSNRHGELSNVLRRTGAGVTLIRVEDLARQLETWFTQWKSGRLQAGIRNEGEIERFSPAASGPNSQASSMRSPPRTDPGRRPDF